MTSEPGRVQGYVFGSPVSRFAFALVEAILLVGNHTISEYLRAGFRDKPGGGPAYWPGGVRCEGGTRLICSFCMERGKAGADSAARCLKGCGAARGSAPSSRNC